jgi:hypothetical protein
MAGQPWQGYRRPSEPFPTGHRHAVPPVIGPPPSPSPSGEPEPTEIATDYVDGGGNRITIRNHPTS